MIKLSQLQLKENMLLVQEQVVEIPQEINGVIRDNSIVEQERASRRFRIGEVLLQGVILDNVISTLPSISSTKGKELVGEYLLYTADAVETLDMPICQDKLGESGEEVQIPRLVFINGHNCFGFVKPE